MSWPLVRCLLIAGAWSPLHAQATTVTLQGVVRAADGTIPIAARIEVRGVETTTSRRTQTDSAGSYRFLGLAPGAYSVSVQASGYLRQHHPDIQLVIGERARLDFTLERGASTLEPVLIHAGRTVDIHRTSISTVVLQEEMEHLPLDTRNVLNLAAIAPGVRTFSLEGGRSVPGAGALPVAESRFTNLYVDGMDWRGMYAGGIIGVPQDGSMVPQEALREFRIYLNPYDAEYSRGASYIVSAVTHRGTNAMQGSLFLMHQNRAMVARGAFQADKPDYRRYQLGGNLRGAVIPDRLFFSASYEGQLTDNYVDVIPPPPAEQPDRWIGFRGTFLAPHRLHNGLVRLTAPYGAHTFDAMVAVRDLRRETGFGVLSAERRMLTHDAGIAGGSSLRSIQLRDSYASQSLVNELSLQLLMLDNSQSLIVPGPALLYPTVQAGRTNYPFSLRDRHVRMTNKTSRATDGLVGSHVLKLGVEASVVRTQLYRPLHVEGTFQFSRDTSSLPTIGRIGLPVSGAVNPGESTVHGWYIGAYLQDEWQPIRPLTITAGVRYDADINTLNQHLIMPWASDTTLRRAVGDAYLNTGDRGHDLDNVAPRIAASWDVGSRGTTVVRVGYGIMYDRVPLYGAMIESRELSWRTYRISNPTTTDPEELRRRAVAGGATATQSITLLKDDLQTPATHQWSIGVGRKLGTSIAVNVDYVDQRVRNVYTSVVLNRPPNLITPRFGDITLWDDLGDARFHGVLTSLTYDRKPTRLGAAYTLGYASSEFGEFTLSDYPDSSMYVMQRSEGDERHRLVVSGLTRLPYLIDFSLIGILASPRPFLVITGTDDNANGSTVDDWPDGMRTHRRDGWEHWYRTLDVRFARVLGNGRGHLTATAELFNVFNTANHAEYQSNGSALEYGEPVTNFAPRQAQLGLRYRF
jgi:hypothetical protein